ncbi:thioesterase superfamily protein [Nocardioides sp. CF8]|uniref:PaaI family thioesterase n=1 Tax=Nocardioides sp. CF8 TaxID=110319 RepID=UPI00032F876F|nr:PaaI family thioesterase [Nocardioides sp. CF8]EON22794.1 thioesterase superfamily protein [Nocardioides sp. CF8]
MSGYLVDDATPDEIEAERATYAPLAEATRLLADLSIRTRVPPADAALAREHLDAAIALLGKDVDDESYGVRHSRAGITRAWGNAVVGIRNPVAPPLAIVHHDDRVSAEFELSAAYEGPPSLVHGGVSALILDQLLGEAAAAAGKPGMTGTLTVRYRRATPLGALRGEARVDRVDGIKTYAVGHIADAEGVCVEAEGVFILPRWARSEQAAPTKFE